MDAAQQLLGVAAALVTIVAPLVAVLWWVLRSAVRQITDEQRRQTAALGDPEVQGSVAHDVRRTAANTDQLHRQVQELQRDAAQWRHVVERVDLLDVLQDNLHTRVGNLEQAVIAYLGGSLREAVAEQDAADARRRERQQRADEIRNRRNDE